MAKQTVGIGTTSRIEYIYIIDSLTSASLGKTSLAYNTSGLSCYYVRNAGSATTITFVSQTPTGSWVSGGFCEVDQINMPGIYRVDLPNAVFASGSDKAIVMIKGVANTTPVVLEYQLTAADPNIFTEASIASTTWSNITRTITGGTLTTNNDKTGYTLLQSFPTNFSNLSITAAGKVSVVQSDLDYIISNIPQTNYTNIAASNWNYLMSGIATSGSFGYQIKMFLDAAISTRSTLTQNQVTEALRQSSMSTSDINKEIFSKLP